MEKDSKELKVCLNPLESARLSKVESENNFLVDNTNVQIFDKQNSTRKTSNIRTYNKNIFQRATRLNRKMF